MSQSPFNAGSWLRQVAKSQQKTSATNNSFIEKEALFALDEKSFRPQDYFVSGWRGDGLASKNALVTVHTLKILEEDVRREFKAQGLFNKALKLDIYNEFLAFAEAQALHCHELDNYQIFWDHLELRQGPYRKELDHFLSIYFLRVAAIYIFKLRFLTVLCQECGLKVEAKDLFNPNSFFAQVFRPGSSQEIKSEALETNHFSWYRPHPSLIDSLKKLAQALPQLSSSEILKGVFQKIEARYHPETGTQQKYSHSLSHTSTGLFINLLLLKLPKWVQEKSSHSESSARNMLLPKSIYCKFTGDHLPSLSLSHWLAQEKASGQKWDQILYPEFKGDQFACGQFMKICFDLQYLTLLCQFAKKQGHSPVSFIGHIMREKGREGAPGEVQMSMFQEVERAPRPYFDRIVLNLVDFPKSNPQFFLINQINSQYNELKEGGLLFVFSSKKLFVPSQSDKVDQLLQKFKLEFVIGLDGIKNRGELAPYIYVFGKKRANLQDKRPFFNTDHAFQGVSDANKRSCYSFRINGDLTSFQKFSSIVDELSHFFAHKRVDSTPLYQSEFGDNFTMEFYQDAVVDGKLINSTKNPANVTHPNFFKNLMKSCIPLDHFFNIEQLSSQGEDLGGPLGLSFKRHDRYPYLIIVDFRGAHQVKLEIASIDAYEAKAQEYGFALCFYFGLTCKRPDININLFREFFSSKLGLQMIQLSLLGKMSKLKSRLNEILIPKFFTEALQIPQHVESAVSQLNLSEEALLQMHPRELREKFEQLLPTLNWLSQKYPWAIMGIMSFFKTLLQNAQSKLLSTREKEGINYNNAVVREVLMKTPSRPIFPDNPEVYIEFKMKNSHDVHSPLSEVTMATVEKHGQLGHFLQLKSNEQTVVEIYSEMVVLNFIKFILENSLNYPISQLLQALSVPPIGALKAIFDKIEDTEHTLEQLEGKTAELIENLIHGQISLNQNRPLEPQLGL